MSGDTTEKVEAGVTNATRPSLGALFARLVAEGEAFVRAEVLLYRAQATRKAFSAGLIVVLIGGAIMFCQALIIVVLMGIMLIIAPSVGIGWAVLIVAAGTLALILMCVMIGRVRIARLLKPENLQ